jgi:hypothetical protein
MTIHSPSGPRTLILDVWENMSLGRITLRWHGDHSEATVVRGKRVVVVVDGAVESIDDFGSSADEWGRLTAQYGVTEKSVAAAIAKGQVVSREPAAATARVR